MISWTAACQAPLSMRSPRQEYWSGLPCPSPGDLSNPQLLHWQADSLQLSIIIEIAGNIEMRQMRELAHKNVKTAILTVFEY